MMSLGLRGKIIVSFCALMLVGGTLSTTLVTQNMSRSLRAEVDRSGLALARVLAEQLGEPLAYGDRLAVKRLLVGVCESGTDVVYAFVSDPSSTIRDHSFSAGQFPADLLEVAHSATPMLLSTERGLVRDLAYPVEQGVLGTLHIGVSMSWVSAVTAAAVGNVLMTTLLASGAGVLGILFLASLITRPIVALRMAAIRLGRGDQAVDAPVVGSGEIAELARTFNQMAAQIRERIEESESLRDYVARVLDQMSSSISVIAEGNEVEYANRVAIETHGPLAGHTCSEVMGAERPCASCPVPEVLHSGAMVERRFSAPSGRTYDLKWLPVTGLRGRPAVVERALDVTDRLALERRFQQAQRLAAAGQISAGVVHAVNNPLDGVRRALELALARPDDRQRVARMLVLAKEGTDRIATVTRTLLGFARGGTVTAPIRVQVVSLVEAAVNLAALRAEARRVILAVEVAEELEAEIDPQGLEEVLVNLLLNAIDACEGGGQVWIEARSDARELTLTVSDNGPGVPDEASESVFEPFYTTKDSDRGTGLGLPVARRIVEAHGGELQLERSSHGGAAFVIRIPQPPRVRSASVQAAAL